MGPAGTGICRPQAHSPHYLAALGRTGSVHSVVAGLGCSVACRHLCHKAGVRSISKAVPNQQSMPLAGLCFPCSGRARCLLNTRLCLRSLHAHLYYHALLRPSSSCYLIVSALDPAWRQMMCWAGMAKFIKLGWEALAGWVHN